MDGLGRMPMLDAAGRVTLPSRLRRHHGPLQRLVESGRVGAATGCGVGYRPWDCGEAEGKPAPAATGAPGQYRQVKLLLHSDHIERLEVIRNDFAKRKLESQQSLLVEELVSAAVGFMLRHVDFSTLQSADALDRHVTASVCLARLWGS